MGISLAAGSEAVTPITVAGVLVVGLTDWLQGSTPAGVIDLGDGPALAVFCLCAIGVAIGATMIVDGGEDDPAMAPWALVVVLATIASLLADPTYAVLLFAVPLVHIARRWSQSLRIGAIGAIFVLAVILISLENQSWGGNNLESAMVLLIALLITTMLGSVLGRLDDALDNESEVARLDERERLAGELHDSVGHSLLATSIQLRTAQALWATDTPKAQRSVELASRAVDDALVDTRIAVDTIRSSSTPFSLTSALPELIDRVTSTSLAVELTLAGPVDSVEQLSQITLYRVAQEALTNVVRHASAAKANVHHMTDREQTVLVISDDGRGFDTDAGAVHLGLRGLEERLERIGGRLDIASRPGKGTTLTATIEETR